jgi:hypothetical protein
MAAASPDFSDDRHRVLRRPRGAIAKHQAPRLPVSARHLILTPRVAGTPRPHDTPQPDRSPTQPAHPSPRSLLAGLAASGECSSAVLLVVSMLVSLFRFSRGSLRGGAQG